MNFKQWLISEEEEKDINLSNPNLTSTIPPLNTSLSNPNLTTTIPPLNTSVSNPSLTTTKISNREIASNKKVEALGKRYQELGRKYPPEFSGFLNTKRAAYKDYTTDTKSIGAIWYPSDIEVAEKNGLPKNWMDSQIEMYKSKNEKNSSERLKELAYYFGRNGSAPSTTDSDEVSKSLFKWLSKHKKKINLNKYKSDDKTWAEMVELSKTQNWIDPVTQKPFPYKDLPDDWRNVKSTNAWQEYLKKKQRTNSENFKELAYYFGRNNAGPSANDSNLDIKYLGKWLNGKKKYLGKWLNGKKYENPNPHEESDKVTWAEMVELSKTQNWIDPVTQKPFPYKDLPDDWRNVKPNVKHEEGKKLSSERLKKLAYYYGRNNAGPSENDFKKENSILSKWLQNKKRKNPNPHEESDKVTWAEMVALSKTWDKEQFPYDLPEKWREVKPAGKKSLGEELVANILNKLGIENDTEHRDAACFNKRCLPFDFSIKNNGKKYFVEYNGEQHYIPAYFGSGEGMTKQEIASDALKEFNIDKENDTKKYDHCVKYKIPFLVIPYWLYKNPDFIENRIIEFLKTNEFNETFANPDVPQKNKEYHDKILKITECFADGKLDCKELFKKQKITFEQFLINKNFINK